MIRVGKLTLDGHDNYGNKLQNYALQHFLNLFEKICGSSGYAVAFLSKYF